jgi:uncharacterized protein YjbI with pentapeptide repeats
MEKKIETIIKVFLVYLAIVIILTIADAKFSSDQTMLFSKPGFLLGFLTNMYNSVIEFIVFTIIILIINQRQERNDKIELFKNNIDDCRFWFSEEAAFRNAGNIKRLHGLLIKRFDLSKCMLSKVKLKEKEFNESLFMGAVIENANFEKSIFEKCDFNGAIMNGVNLSKTNIEKCNMKYVKLKNAKINSAMIVGTNFSKAIFYNSNFDYSIIRNCDFSSADLTGCSFERADLRWSNNLTIDQLLSCANIKYTKLDKDLMDKLQKTKGSETSPTS